MTTLSSALASKHFPADEVSRLIEDTNHPQRLLVFSALRAESDQRFLQGLGAFFETLDWSGVATAQYGHHPMVAMLGAARNESATDHLAARDIVQFCSLADKPDTGFALDVVHAVELGDEAAGARVRERVAQKMVSAPGARGMFSAPDNAVAGLRTATFLRGLIADTDEDQLRKCAELGFGYGAYAAYVAASIAASRGIEIGEDVVSLQDSRRLCARVLTRVAFAIDPALGQDVLELVVAKDWHDGDLESFDLPWSRSVEQLKAGKLTVTRLLGTTVFKATGPFDTYSGPPPRKRASYKVSLKRHPAEAKAVKDLDKAAADKGEEISFQQADLDARLHHVASTDAGRERVAELLRRGASPNHVDSGRGTTALHRATSSADCGDIVRRLLAAGGDVSKLDGSGWSVLDNVNGGTAAHERAAERLVAAGARCHQPRLFSVAESGYHRLVPALVRAGCDPSESRNGKTPMDVALEKKHLRTAVALGYRP